MTVIAHFRSDWKGRKEHHPFHGNGTSNFALLDSWPQMDVIPFGHEVTISLWCSKSFFTAPHGKPRVFILYYKPLTHHCKTRSSQCINYISLNACSLVLRSYAWIEYESCHPCVLGGELVLLRRWRKRLTVVHPEDDRGRKSCRRSALQHQRPAFLDDDWFDSLLWPQRRSYMTQHTIHLFPSLLHPKQTVFSGAMKERANRNKLTWSWTSNTRRTWWEC